jgi:hypothetical protein
MDNNTKKRSSHKHLKPAENLQIRLEYILGTSAASLASMFGCTAASIHRQTSCREYGRKEDMHTANKLRRDFEREIGMETTDEIWGPILHRAHDELKKRAGSVHDEGVRRATADRLLEVVSRMGPDRLLWLFRQMELEGSAPPPGEVGTEPGSRPRRRHAGSAKPADAAGRPRRRSGEGTRGR